MGVNTFRHYIKLILDNNEKEAFKKFEEILKEIDGKEWRLEYKIKASCNEKENLEQLANHFINNLSYYKKYLNDNTILGIIREIGLLLKEDLENKEMILDFSEKLNHIQLVSFIYAIKKNPEIDFIPTLTKILIEKINQLDKPFFLQRNASIAILSLYSSYNYNDLNDYLKKTLNSREHICLFLKNFSSFWNNEFFGMFKSEDFYKIKSDYKIDTNHIYHKIMEFFSNEIPTKKTYEVLKKSYIDKWDNLMPNTCIDRVKQFVYYYLKDIKRE